MKVDHTIELDGSLKITINIESQEVTCLKHDLSGIQGIVDWYAAGPSSEKLFRCKERLMDEGIKMLRSSGKAVPADDSALIGAIVGEPSYKDREARNVLDKEVPNEAL